jgi:hypothetical protein
MTPSAFLFPSGPSRQSPLISLVRGAVSRCARTGRGRRRRSTAAESRSRDPTFAAGSGWLDGAATWANGHVPWGVGRGGGSSGSDPPNRPTHEQARAGGDPTRQPVPMCLRSPTTAPTCAATTHAGRSSLGSGRVPAGGRPPAIPSCQRRGARAIRSAVRDARRPPRTPRLVIGVTAWLAGADTCPSYAGSNTGSPPC